MNTSATMVKGKKDPNKPKGVKSAYIYFTEHERAEREKNGNSVSFTELSRLCGPIWGTMTEDDKAPFQKQTEKDRKRYEKEMESYIPPSDSDSDDEGPKRKKVKKVKDPNAPKKNLSAYFHFAADKRPEIKEENPGIVITEQAKKIGILWKALEKEDKEPYEKLAEKDRERYAKELAAYNKTK